MKIALCSSFVPFIFGGARNIVEWLESMLKLHGHQVEHIYLPAIETPDSLMPQFLAYRWLRIENADRIICFRPPAYLIPHPNKVLWFIHHIRAFYDLWDTQYRNFPDNGRNRMIRNVLREIDTQALRESRAIFTNSAVVSDRLRHFNNLESEILYPPIYNPEQFHCRGFNDEVVYICRVEHHKRQHLLLEALRYTTCPIKIRICGSTSDHNYVESLRAIIRDYRLENRVHFNLGWISEEQKVEYLADCLAAAYLPLDEDSYGYPSIEASHSGKPILTTTDAGGVMELVRHQYNGLICEPNPESVALGLDQLYNDRHLTEQMGQNALKRLEELGINWDRVLSRLLA